MSRNKFLYSLALSGCLLISSASLVNAQIQNISEDAAINASSTIKLKVGRGINLKLPEGVKVYKGWIDNGSIAEVDGDRPFVQGASLLHLKAKRAALEKVDLNFDIFQEA